MEFIQKSPAAGGDGCAFRNEKAPADTEAFRKTASKAHYGRKFPPYGKPSMARLREGNRPSNCVWIACGAKAWERAQHDLQRNDSAALCLPPGDDPTSYHWPVAGLPCLVIHTGGCSTHTLIGLGEALIHAGAALAVFIGAEDVLGNPIVTFKGRLRDE